METVNLETLMALGEILQGLGTPVLLVGVWALFKNQSILHKLDRRIVRIETKLKVEDDEI